MKEKQVAKLCAAMEQAKLGCMLVCPSEEMLFLAGYSPMMCERFQGLFISASGEYFYVCNKLYQGEVEHALDGIKTYPWLDGESMTEVVGLALKEHGLLGKTIGVNSTAPAFNLLDIARECGVKFVNGTAVLEEARIIKSAQEVDDLRTSAKITDDAFAAALDFIKPGVTEGDILSFLTEKMTAAGGADCWGIIASGPNSSYPHYLGTQRVLQDKDLLILDFGCTYHGMYSDMSRTVFIGGITDEERKIYDIVRRAQKAGVDAAVNGAFIPDIDAAARDIIIAEGYGDNFINRVGHGIGYMMHEGPYIKKDNRRHLEPGMAFSIEPGIYLADHIGMRIEDIVVATEQGHEVLNHATKEIVVL